MATPETRGAETIIEYTRIAVDDEGGSYFSDETVSLDEADIVPPSPPVNMAEPVPASGLTFVTLPAGWPGDVHEPHVAAGRSYWFVLSGEMEIATTDGETRQFSPGSVILTDDTTGKGHATTVLGERGMRFAVVQAPE